MNLDPKGLEAAIDEAGSGWEMHLKRENKVKLMGEAIKAYLQAVQPTNADVDWVESYILEKLKEDDKGCYIAVNIYGNNNEFGEVQIDGSFHKGTLGKAAIAALTNNEKGK